MRNSEVVEVEEEVVEEEMMKANSGTEKQRERDTARNE